MEVYAAHIESLQADPDYPNNPSGCSLLTDFNVPRDWNDNYGTRVRGYLYAPVTGMYTFWVAGDNDADLFLSTDHNPINAFRIAYNPNINIPPAYQNFNLYPEQRSNPVFLEAGQPYYIEALHQEMGIDDNLTVAWQGAGIPSRSVITGAYLAPYTNCGP
jgi:xyloglucan-specific exo-beta-1,4-glucanase